MDIIIQSLGFKASDALENYTREKVSSLKGDKIVRANVTLYKGSAGNPDDYCEIRLEVPGNDLFVKKHNPQFETAIVECVNVLALQIGKAKDRKLDLRQADAEKIQDELLKDDGNDTELEDVVR